MKFNKSNVDAISLVEKYIVIQTMNDKATQTKGSFEPTRYTVNEALQL